MSPGDTKTSFLECCESDSTSDQTNTIQARDWCRHRSYNSSDTMMSTLHSIRAYAKTLGDDSYGRPRFEWSTDYRILSIDNIELDICQMRTWIYGLVVKTKTL